MVSGKLAAIALALAFSSLPAQAASVTFRTIGVVSAVGTTTGANWTGNHPIQGETFIRDIVIDDAALPISYSHVHASRLDSVSAEFAATESWDFLTSGIAVDHAISMGITADNITGQVSLDFGSSIYTGYSPISVTRSFRSDATITELVYLMGQGPLFHSSSILNLGDPNDWMGSCTKTVYRAWCYVTLDVVSSGLADPGYVLSVPPSFAEQRSLLAAVPVPASVFLTLAPLALMTGAGLWRTTRRRCARSASAQ